MHAQDHVHARKEKVAFNSILASAALALGKFIAGILSGSLGLLSEAAHSLVDTGATIITYFALRSAHTPADNKHQYGHAKFESLAALAQTVVLFVLAAVVFINAATRVLAGGGDFQPTVLAFAVLLASLAIDANRIYCLRKVARETGSQALAADALHFASDMAGTLLVLAGLVAALFGFRYGDALAAAGVAAFIAVAGWRLGAQTIDTLLDTAPRGMAERIRAIVSEVAGVVGIEQLRIRSAGAENFGDITILVSRTLPLDRVMTLKGQIVAAIHSEFPNTWMTVTTLPRALDNETVLERIMLTAAKRRLPVHHVTVQDIGERLSIGLDIEVDGRMSLLAAHGLASKFEAAMRDEFGADIEIDTHIEPLVVPHLAGEDAPADIADCVNASILQIASDSAIIRDIHDVRVRKTPGGLVVSYHCRADASVDVQTVHKNVDRLERETRRLHPQIIRVIGHAEPDHAMNEA